MVENGKSMAFLTDALLTIEKLRVATNLRMQAFNRLGRPQDPHTVELHRRLVETEDYITGEVKKTTKELPGYRWFSRVKGVGDENIAKVISFVDFEKAKNLSSLRKFAGFAPKDGKAMKPVENEKLEYCADLRAMCWRLGSSLLRGQKPRSGSRKPPGKFYQYYLNEKEKYYQRFLNTGYKIMPTPKEKGKKKEPPGVIFEGHLHNMALRKMLQLFLGCLWLVAREDLGLPTRPPYAVEKLKHKLIDPWEMVDR